MAVACVSRHWHNPYAAQGKAQGGGIASYSDDSHRAGFVRGGTSCNAAMRPTGRTPHVVAGLTMLARLTLSVSMSQNWTGLRATSKATGIDISLL